MGNKGYWFVDKQNTGLGITANVLLSPVKAIVLIFMVQTCQRSLRERFLSSVREIMIKPGL